MTLNRSGNMYSELYSRFCCFIGKTQNHINTRGDQKVRGKMLLFLYYSSVVINTLSEYGKI